jgi:hypothetical protein
MIYRANLKADLKTLYVFGDNLKGFGMGGQAGQMRGEPNAIGIPTKIAPDMQEKSFFDDGKLCYMTVTSIIESRFRILEDHLRSGLDVVWPEDGIGTGLAQLPERAPRIHKYIEDRLWHLQQL